MAKSLPRVEEDVEVSTSQAPLILADRALEIRKFVRPAASKARKKIRETWATTEVKEQKEQPAHTPAVEAYKKMEETAPRGIAGADLAPEAADRIAEQAARDLAETLPEGLAKDPEQLQELKRQIQNQTITVLDGDWPGKELFEIDHLDGKVIIRLNWRHPFMREIYCPLREIAAGKGLDDLSPTLLQALGKQIMAGMDVLLFTQAGFTLNSEEQLAE